ncbi:glycosyltransferase family 4 protein [Xylanimonas sp. McL0601]|uniref:glycosyltransferase family 4 protein n=1 Tax=Xylanimonas sp. McL0601 TaxID=3414739 RepID=UPI003CEA2142
MRVLHLSDSFLPRMGGIEVQVARLAARQVAAGNAVDVLTTTPAAPGARGCTTTVGDDGVRVHRVAARVPGGFPVHPRSTHHVLARLDALDAAGERPDAVHLHAGVLAPTVQRALRAIARRGLPAVVTVHSVWDAPTERAFALLDRTVRWSALPVLWSAVSELTADPVRRIVTAAGGDPAGRVVVLGNGVDVGSWRGYDRVERDDRAVAKGAVHVVSTARFARRKRMLPLVGALVAAARELPTESLVATLVGDGEQLAAARTAVGAAGLADVVRLPGRLASDELHALYAEADVFVAPAVKEAFGIAALEARAAGLAIVTHAGSGVGERLEDGVDGLVADGDAAITRAVVRLVEDPALLDRLVAHNRAHPPASDWAHVLEATAQAYRRAVQLVR